MDEIPFDQVINGDQTSVCYVSISSWTMEKEGSKMVEIVVVGDKRQITTVLAGLLAGDFLLPQLIYKGFIKWCLAGVNLTFD